MIVVYAAVRIVVGANFYFRNRITEVFQLNGLCKRSVHFTRGSGKQGFLQAPGINLPCSVVMRDSGLPSCDSGRSLTEPVGGERGVDESSADLLL